MSLLLCKVYKREYNSDRRRKLILFLAVCGIQIIRENITPIGDGNKIKYLNMFIELNLILIRENITPIGDGNIF